ncbi:MAG: hypothetical protein JXB49_25140 [Bacteroidales bacterium]|nr:hypothetical protein [Bacteroidales bacterium]
MKRYIYLATILLLVSANATGQATYVHVSNTRIYDFLDELANEKFITLNSAVKPYTRNYIYIKLSEADTLKDKLKNRQREELAFYLDYYAFGNQFNYLPSRSKLNLFKKSAHSSTSLNHLAYFYSDSLFNFSLRPIMGLEYFSNSSGHYTRTYRGLEAFASVGKHLAVYADLRDNTVNKILVQPGYFTREPGGIYKGSPQLSGGADFSEMRGGILLSWDFLQVGIVKDHPVWGNNYNGATIYSGHTPSVPMVKLHINPVKWFDFNYFHAWLVSDVVDSSLTYLLPNGIHRDTYKNKFLAANMFTFIPIRGLNLSFGNSIIYSDQSVNLAYLIPIFFYKSVDHTLTSNKIVNQNSQMFVDISARLLKHTHFYLTAYWDDFAAKRASDPDIHNFYSYKIGGKISNWPLSNVSITGEYFRSVPINYKHYVPTLTYESNSYNMGHWLRDNSEEKFIAVDVKPFPRLHARYAYTNARHGNEYSYIDGGTAVTYPILQDNTWTSVSHSLVFSYEILTNCHITLEYLHSNTKGYDVDGQTAQYYLDRFTPEFFQGKKNTFLLRFNIGF